MAPSCPAPLATPTPTPNPNPNPDPNPTPHPSPNPNPAPTPSLTRLARAHLSPSSGTLLLAYPNSGEVWSSGREMRCWHGGEDEVVLDGSHALGMQRAGADGLP